MFFFLASRVTMNPGTKARCCPLCKRTFAALASHLKRYHSVNNLDERKILLNYSSGRVNVRDFPCNVTGCSYNKSRFDFHMRSSHFELSLEEKKEKFNAAKMERTISLLRNLRESNPHPALVSKLDISSEPCSEEDLPSPPLPAPGLQETVDVSPAPEEAEVTPAVETAQPPEQRPSQVRKSARLNNSPRVSLHRLNPASAAVPRRPAARLDVSPDRPPEAVTGHNRFPRSIDQYLDVYQTFLEGFNPSDIRKQSARNRVWVVKEFLAFMGRASRVTPDWLFLDDVGQIYRWASHLTGKGKKVSTVLCYSKQIQQFVKYMSDTPPDKCKISKVQFFAILRTIRRCLTEVRTHCSTYQMNLRARKAERGILLQTLTRCRDLASIKIPQLLEAMAANPTRQLTNSFFGYFAAFISCIFGHRRGVIVNMTVKEVMEAKKKCKSPGEGYLINVHHHKTRSSYGTAQIFLKREEFMWLEQWLKIRARLRPNTDLVLCSGSKSVNRVIDNHLRNAWSEMGLPGRPTFTDIRTAVATHVKNLNPTEQRARMSHFMCHSTTTADQFYVLPLNSDQARDIRGHFDRTMNQDGL